MKNIEQRKKELLESLLKENSSSDKDFKKYEKSLKKYKKESDKKKSKYEKELEDLFSGSKITSRFIFRSISTPTKNNYEKDCKDFGKEKFDDLVDEVLSIIK